MYSAGGSHQRQARRSQRDIPSAAVIESMKTQQALLVSTLLFLAGLAGASAQDTIITYQGRVTSSGTNFTGTGQFKTAIVASTNHNHTATATANLSGGFVTSYTVTLGGSGYVSPPSVTITGGGGSGATAIANVSGGVVTSVTPGSAGSGYTSAPTVTLSPPPDNISFTTHWSNDGTSVNGSEPASPVGVGVSNGLFTIGLGDTSLANMMALNAALFVQPNLQLRLWFNDGVSGFAVLNPPQKLTHAPYAAFANTASNANSALNVSGSISASQITGAISSNNIGAGTITSTMLAAGAVGPDQLAAGAVTASKVAIVSNWFALTIPNPTPAINEHFGFSVAAMGTDRILIGSPLGGGASGAGAAHLFSTNGAVITTFTNPAATPNDLFGNCVAAMGNDRVIIGANGNDTGASAAGVAYLFSTNGGLITTFTNPTPANADNFGVSVAAVGADRVLIGAPVDDAGATDAGVAYLFRTNGTLLVTFTNPAPAIGDRFGISVTAISTDRVVIGADGDDTGASDAGAAYLFSTNGALLTTFTNPTPAAGDAFGHSLAAVAADLVLISAHGDSTGASGAGAVYLFSTNGTLLTTFTNPAPANGDFFGISVAAVGADRVLIGAEGDNVSAGAAYLFSTNGTLLTTFTSPTPADGDFFGVSVAAVGSDRVLIGANDDDIGATDSGAAYLFSLATYAPGLITEGVNPGSVTTASLGDGAVTLAKLDPATVLWSRSDGSDNIYHSPGKVGIGTDTPTALLHLRGVGPVINLQDTASAADQAGYVSYRNNSSVETAWVGFGTPGSPTFSVVNTRGNIELLPLGTGKVGISRSPTVNALEVEGNASKTTAGSFLANSDARIKTKVHTVTGALDKLSQVRLVEFHYTDNYRAQHPAIKNRSYLNVVAQEFEKVFPEDVQPSGDKLPNGDTILQVDTYPLTIYSAAAIQELNRKLTEELKRRDAENADLKARVEKLEQGLKREGVQ